jgi:polyisoprenoid-binding protein YceI
VQKPPSALGVAVAAAITAAAVAAPPAARASDYAIDPTHTFVHFEVPHFGTSTTRGRFDRKEGTLTFDRAAKTGKVEITIETASVDTGIDAFDLNLRGKDFLNAEQHPTAKFTADRFVFQGDKVTEVTGVLTLLGKAQPVTLKATNFNCYLNPLLRRETCGGDFGATILRSRWGMDWGLNFGFSDEVRLLVQVEAIKQ